MRLLALALIPVALALAGCGGDDPDRSAARALVQRHVLELEGYDASDVRCTGNPRPWFVEQAASVYICAVGRGQGDCDWFRVEVRDGEPEVRLEARRAGCVLPA